MLVDHPGRIYTRDQLMDAMYRDERVVADRTVDSHIKKIRRKITAVLPELGNARINSQIDRLAVTADAVLIADFKTNRPPPASPEKVPRIYRTQMALYRAALQKIYPGKRIDCALVWTDGARLMPLPHELLDAEIAAIAAG